MKKLKMENELLLRAYKNLTRQLNYIQLCLERSEGHINEDDFNEEMQLHPDRYALLTEKDLTQEELGVLCSLIDEKIQENYSIDDLSDIFGVTHESLLQVIRREI